MKREIFLILCGILCLGYCILIFSIHSGSRFYIIWALGGAFFLALAAMSHYRLWDKLPGGLKNIITVVMIVCLLLFVVVECCILSGFREKGRSNLDYIIVLGAQVKAGGPSMALQYRLDKAYDYLVENEDTICIVSGGQGANEPFSEAQGMYDYLTGRGIASERIIMEDQSTDTSENIRFSTRFLDMENDSVGIVTNNFHVFRSVRLAKHNGIKKAYGISAKSNAIFQINNMFREFFGIIKDLVCGNLI